MQRDATIEQLETKLHAAVNDKAMQVSDLNLIIFRYAIVFFGLSGNQQKAALRKSWKKLGSSHRSKRTNAT